MFEYSKHKHEIMFSQKVINMGRVGYKIDT